MPNSLRIKQLIVVAGPSASGKHSLIQSLQSGGKGGSAETDALIPGIKDHEDFSTYRHLRTDLLPWVEETEIDKALLHFDIIHAYDDRNAWQKVSDLMGEAKNVVVITLVCHRRILLSRLMWRMLTIFRPDARWPDLQLKRFLDLWSKRKIYSGPDRLLPAYDRWETLVATHPGTRHLLLDTGKDPDNKTIQPVPYCRRRVEQILYPRKAAFERRSQARESGSSSMSQC